MIPSRSVRSRAISIIVVWGVLLSVFSAFHSFSTDSVLNKLAWTTGMLSAPSSGNATRWFSKKLDFRIEISNADLAVSEHEGWDSVDGHVSRIVELQPTQLAKVTYQSKTWVFQCKMPDTTLTTVSTTIFSSDIDRP